MPDYNVEREDLQALRMFVAVTGFVTWLTYGYFGILAGNPPFASALAMYMFFCLVFFFGIKGPYSNRFVATVYVIFFVLNILRAAMRLW